MQPTPETERDDVPLAGRQVRNCVQYFRYLRVLFDLCHGIVGGDGHGVAEFDRSVSVHPAVVVDDEVVGNTQQPSGERLALTAVGADTVECSQEDFLGEVLGLFNLPGVHVDVLEDQSRVLLIE